MLTSRPKSPEMTPDELEKGIKALQLHVKEYMINQRQDGKRLWISQQARIGETPTNLKSRGFLLSRFNQGTAHQRANGNGMGETQFHGDFPSACLSSLGRID